MYGVMSSKVSQEQQEKEMRRRMAVIQSGYAFIVLELIDKKKRRVSGIEDLVARPSEDGMKYKFEVVQRQLEFCPDPNRGNIWSAYVLVTDKNKEFLASHFEEGYWEVVSVISGRKSKVLILEEVLGELANLKQELIQRSIDKPQEMPRLLPTDTKRYDIANIDDDLLEKELARRKAEREREIDVKASLPKKPETEPVEGENVVVHDEGKAKRGRRKKAAIVESSKESDIVDDSKDEPIVESGAPDSEFINTGPIGVVQP